MTFKEAAQMALDVQDACNMGGVARTFPEVVQAVREEATRLGKGTDWVNQHPIVQAYADKIIDLARAREMDVVFKAFAACEGIVAP